MNKTGGGGNMTKEDLGFQVSPTRLLPITRERIGLIVDGANAASAVKTIVAAEAADLIDLLLNLT
jgi:hypothetical protein